MALSGDTTFNVTRDNVIDDALAGLGVIGPGENAVGPMRDHAARALDMVAKAIDAEGRFMWRTVRRSQSLTSGTASYTLGTDVIDVLDPGNYRTSVSATSRQQVGLMALEEFMRIADRTIAGVPSRMLLEETLPTGRSLTLWPVPNVTASYLDYTVRIRAQDHDDGSNNPDFPSRFAIALVLGLQAHLAPTYGQTEMVAIYDKRFRAELTRQTADSGEKGPLQLVPFGGHWQ